MSETHETPEFQQGQVSDVESLLLGAAADRAAREPARRVEETLSAVTEAAAEELSAWAEEPDLELAALRDPRNWVSRPPAAAGTVAAAPGC